MRGFIAGVLGLIALGAVLVDDPGHEGERANQFGGLVGVLTGALASWFDPTKPAIPDRRPAQTGTPGLPNLGGPASRPGSGLPTLPGSSLLAPPLGGVGAPAVPVP